MVTKQAEEETKECGPSKVEAWSLMRDFHNLQALISKKPSSLTHTEDQEEETPSLMNKRLVLYLVKRVKPVQK